MQSRTILLTLVLLLAAALLSAHSASAVNAAYDAKTKQLTVNFKHQVKDNANHYIDQVTISVNRKQAITQKLSLQDSKEGGTLVYRINSLKSGDKVVVSVRCNKSGTKNQTLTVK